MEVYRHWDTKPPSVPARSTLYSLAPLGVGTAEVESLTGFIARLAQEHCLTPFTLLYKTAGATIGDRYQIRKSGIHPQLARSLNGVGSKTQAFTEALEFLTSRSDVRYTALTTYADVLSRQQLVRPQRAWCSACLAEQARHGTSVYETLLWSVMAVTACENHRKLLTTICPRCKREQAPLSSFMHPGYCGKCRSWLGVDQDRRTSSDDLIAEDELNRRLWVTATVGDLLAATSRLIIPPTKKQFISRLELCISLYAAQSINTFSSHVGIWHGSIRRLLKGEVLPSMAMLLQLSSRLNLPIIALLSSEEEALPTAGFGMGSRNYARKENCSSSQAERLDFTDVEKVMLAALGEQPPPSASEIQRRTGRKIETLKRRLPDLYDQICARYRSFHRPEQVSDEGAEAALKAALKQNPPPSLQNVFRLLGCRSTGYRFYARFPNLCRAVAARYREHRNKPFDVEEARRSLEEMLTECPAPSFSEAARRLGHGRLFIRTKFPELSAALSGRHKSWLCKQRDEGRKALRQEVETAIRDLTAEGLYASNAHIQGRLSRHWHGATFIQVIREVKETLGLLK